MDIKVLGNRVLIKQNDSDGKTKGGIIIPSTAQEKPLIGKVLAIGEGDEGHPMVIKVGDEVIYDKEDALKIRIEDVDYIILEATNVYAII